MGHASGNHPGGSHTPGGVLRRCGLHGHGSGCLHTAKHQQLQRFGLWGRAGHFWKCKHDGVVCEPHGGDSQSVCCAKQRRFGHRGCLPGGSNPACDHASNCGSCRGDDAAGDRTDDIHDAAGDRTDDISDAARVGNAIAKRLCPGPVGLYAGIGIHARWRPTVYLADSGVPEPSNPWC